MSWPQVVHGVLYKRFQHFIVSTPRPLSSAFKFFPLHGHLLECQPSWSVLAVIRIATVCVQYGMYHDYVSKPHTFFFFLWQCKASRKTKTFALWLQHWARVNQFPALLISRMKVKVSVRCNKCAAYFFFFFLKWLKPGIKWNLCLYTDYKLQSSLQVVVVLHTVICLWFQCRRTWCRLAAMSGRRSLE